MRHPLHRAEASRRRIIVAAPKHGTPRHGAVEKPEKEKTAPAVTENETMAAERKKIISWLKTVRFRRRLFGGVDEKNVWRKIAELDALYTKALEAERVRYDVLLAEARKRAAGEEDEAPDAAALAEAPGAGPETGGDPLG